MSSAESGKHRLQRRLVTEGEPGDLARWDVAATRLGLTWSAWVRAVQNESVSMPEVIIYGIRVVGTEEVRYVGATALRLTERRKEGYPGRLGEWLPGVEWEYVELERTTVARATEAEARWIAQLGDSLMFNTGARPAAPGSVCLPVELSRATHASALEIAAAGHWSLGAFVQLAVEQLVERMKRGERVAVGLSGAASAEPSCEIIYWCGICGNVQRETPSGICCSDQDHGGAASIRSLARAAEIRAIYATRRMPDDEYERSTRPVAPAPARLPHGPRGSASNPNSAFARRDDNDLDEEASA